MWETKSFTTAAEQEEHKHVLMLQELKVFEDTLEQVPALPANVWEENQLQFIEILGLLAEKTIVLDSEIRLKLSVADGGSSRDFFMDIVCIDFCTQEHLGVNK